MKKILLPKLRPFLLSFLFVVVPISAGAHCDRVNGPVATDAREALQSGSINPVAIWVGAEEMPELRDAFEQSLGAFKMGGEAKDVAEQYFMSTAVRLHRQAEGFPFEGLKPAQPVPEDIALAEKALNTGEIQLVTTYLSKELQNQTERLFQNAMEKKQQKDQSVDAGREWADAYVKYVIFVHALHQSIQSGAPHGIEQ